MRFAANSGIALCGTLVSWGLFGQQKQEVFLFRESVMGGIQRLYSPSPLPLSSNFLFVIPNG
jgi:hypothetical protein